MQRTLFKFILSIVLLLFCGITFSVIKPDDIAIVKNINRGVKKDKMVSGLNVTVESQNGVVTLIGNINTEDEGHRLVQIAESNPGVKDVATDKLVIKSSKNPLGDTFITAKVKGTFLREKLFGKKTISIMPITVETTNGVVFLTGVVDDPAIVKNAISLAKSVKGVKNVESKIEIKKPGPQHPLAH